MLFRRRNVRTFQSAPALCRAGDGGRCGYRSAYGGFNPRPLFAERATWFAGLDDKERVVSIRARSLQSGRLFDYAKSKPNFQFQSAPALCRAGDAQAQAPAPAPAEFQSAPALCRAGDFICFTKGVGGTEFQSAPALCRAGDHIRAAWNYIHMPFQSAPALCRAGDSQSSRHQALSRCFNPRPLFAERATPRAFVAAQHRIVSIRARSLQSGRLGDAIALRNGIPFQSAPALCRAGDRRARSRGSR